MMNTFWCSATSKEHVFGGMDINKNNVCGEMQIYNCDYKYKQLRPGRSMQL